MKKITLSVDDKNLETVLTILENLKNGLIEKIETDINFQRKSTQYKPKKSGVIYEHESGTNDTNGKYLSASAYKKRLQNKQ